MKRGVGLLIYLAISLVSCTLAFGQDQYKADSVDIYKEWFLGDPLTDHVQGVSAEKTYRTLLKDKPSRTVLVAVIDSGIDIDHEDLKDIIWVNEDEIPGNGIDDDKNGYVDDIHGWNFIGGKDGTNVGADTYELTREYVRLKARYGDVDEKKVKRKQRDEYQYWKKIEKDFDSVSTKAKEQYNFYSTIYTNLSKANEILKEASGEEKINSAIIDSLKSTDQQVQLAKASISIIFKNIGPDADIDAVLDELKEAVDHFETQVKYGYNPDFDSRKIVGDDPHKLYERNYGNNDVEGPDPDHGTHVAGIIAANRKNDIGIKGIADNVRIMSVRAVPDGDEHDKDVANAIIYAVDNGAQIINMSFGKSYSPDKVAVDKAVKYAESKGVLLIHAAGNDGENIDKENNFPTSVFLNGKEAKNWIEVGASAWGRDDEFVAPFSNYGKKNVDLFAPGVDIYSTVPNNKYKENSGTSMASPSTAGVAALLMSYFPTLSATDVRDILLESSRKFDNLKVTQPGAKESVNFSSLSASGGVVNAYEAVKMAMSMSNSKKIE